MYGGIESGSFQETFSESQITYLNNYYYSQLDQVKAAIDEKILNSFRRKDIIFNHDKTMYFLYKCKSFQLQSQ